ncbi:MAG: YgjP-like metallopeptidase domain-containing protein [Nitrososphaeria archaeon]
MSKYKAILEEARRDFGINDDFKIIMKKMKVKAASISFKTRVIRINKELDCDPEFIDYLIYHELAHYKLGTKLHNKEFYELLNSRLEEKNVKNIEKRILRKMLEINHVSRYFD